MIRLELRRYGRPSSGRMLSGVGLGHKKDWMLQDCAQMQVSAVVAFGSPPQEFNIMLDTGSADLWVLQTGCKGSMCEISGPRYDPYASTTSTMLHLKPYRVTYGDLSGFSGDIWIDKVTIAGLEMMTSFASITLASEPSACDYPHIQGMLGLAFDSLNSWKHGVPFGMLVKQTKIVPVFAFSMGDPFTAEGAHVTLGGMDQDDYEGCITWVPCVFERPTDTDPVFWRVSMGPEGGMSVGDGPIIKCPEGGCTAMPDSGTSFLTGYVSDVSRLLAALDAKCVIVDDEAGTKEWWPCALGIQGEEGSDYGGEQVAAYLNEDDNGDDFKDSPPFEWEDLSLAQVPCDSVLPDVVMNLDLGDGQGIQRMPIGQEYYMFPSGHIEGQELEGHCVLGIGWFVARSAATWVLGDTAMRAYYTAHDYGGLRIGFARATIGGRRESPYCAADEELSNLRSIGNDESSDDISGAGAQMSLAGVKGTTAEGGQQQQQHSVDEGKMLVGAVVIATMMMLVVVRHLLLRKGKKHDYEDIKEVADEESECAMTINSSKQSHDSIQAEPR